MSDSLRDHIGVTQPKRFESARLRSEGEVNAIGAPDLPLDHSKRQLGLALRHALKVSKTVLKEVGDPSFVCGLCEGDKIPDWLGRLWASPERQRALIEALAEQSGQYHRQVSLHQKTGT